MAGTEGVLGGSDLAQWLNSLRRPRVYAPLWVWILVAIVTYLLQGIIAYRLLATGPTGPAIAAFAALVAVMAANVAYNVVLNRTREPRWAYYGLLWFLPVLILLQLLLHLSDPGSAMLNLLYVIWVVGYDLPVMRAIWKLNSH
jgi:tryptophan-rich sensory protein